MTQTTNLGLNLMEGSDPVDYTKLNDNFSALDARVKGMANGYVRVGQKSGTTIGPGATAEGYNTTASGNYSHAEGYNTTASGNTSHAEGSSTTASETGAHAEGTSTVASNYGSHAEGDSTTASGAYSHAEGNRTTASNYASHAGGHYSEAMTSGGKLYNTVGDAMVIGNGTSDSARANCFRVTYTGAVYGLSAFNASGADYAEFFEWADGNPDNQDRVGYFVTLEGNKIRLAGAGEYALGVVSGQPCIIGNADEDWLGRWQHDEFGRFVLEYLEENEVEVTPPEGLDEAGLALWMAENQVTEREGAYYRTEAVAVDRVTPSWRHKANPDYDPALPYVERKDRPEWSAVGMLGVLSVRDDGSCQAGGFCKVTAGGVATAAAGELEIVDGQVVKGYRVVERASANVVRVVFR